jgi:DNA-binding transcriptional LysR family regulator
MPKTCRILQRTAASPSKGSLLPPHGPSRRARPNVPCPIRSRLRVNTAEAAIDAAIAGVGVTRVPSYQIAAAVRSGTLYPLLQAFEPLPWPVSLIHAGQGLLPVKLRAFLDFAAPRLKERLVQATWQA